MSILKKDSLKKPRDPTKLGEVIKSPLSMETECDLLGSQTTTPIVEEYQGE